MLRGGALGSRQRLETLVGDRFAALDREPVRPGRKARFGAFDRGELSAKHIGKTLIEFGVVQDGCLVGEMLDGRRLVAGLRSEPAEALPDSATLALEQFTGPLRIHDGSLHPRRHTDSRHDSDPTRMFGVAEAPNRGIIAPTSLWQLT